MVTTGLFSSEELDIGVVVGIGSTDSVFCVGVTGLTDACEAAAENCWEGLFSVNVRSLV